MSPPTAYLIITHNGEDHIERLLKSIPEKSLIVIFDNASKDETVEIAHQYTNHIIESPQNLGYAAGINKGLEYIQKVLPPWRGEGGSFAPFEKGGQGDLSQTTNTATSYVLILNQDTQLPAHYPPSMKGGSSRWSSARGESSEQESNTQSVNYLDYLVIQPRILLPNGNVNVDELEMNIFGFVYPPDFDTAPKIKQPKQTTFFSGAAFLINLEKYQQIGPFDESLFMYYEDIDYALRIALAEEKILFDPTWSVTHFYSNSALHARKRKALLKNSSIIIARYFPSLWQRLLLPTLLRWDNFLPWQKVREDVLKKKNLSIKDQNHLAKLLLKTEGQKEGLSQEPAPCAQMVSRGETFNLPPSGIRLGFDTKQFSPIKRFLINLIMKPIGWSIRQIVNRSLQ